MTTTTADPLAPLASAPCSSTRSLAALVGESVIAAPGRRRAAAVCAVGVSWYQRSSSSPPRSDSSSIESSRSSRTR